MMMKLCYSFGRNVIKPLSKHNDESIKQLLKDGMTDQQIYKQLAPKITQIVALDEITKKVKDRAHTASLKLKEDIAFKNLAKQDQKDSMKDLDIYIDDSKMGDSRLKSVKLVERDDSFVVEQQKIDKLSGIMGMKGDDYLVKSLVKDEMFVAKKLQEQDFIFRESLKKLDKQRQLRKVQKNLNSVEWDDHPDLDRKTLQATKKFREPENLQQLDSHLIKDPYALQKFRTTQNMTEFVHQFLFERKPNFDIVVNGVNTNASCTVVFIFWGLSSLQQAQQSQTRLTLNTFKEVKENLIKDLTLEQSKMQKQLNLFSGYMGGRMCQALGLKYAPSIRFVISTRLQNFENLKQEFMDHHHDLIREELIEEYQQGLRGSTVTQKDYANLVSKMEEGILDHSYAEAQETTTKKSPVKNKKKTTTIKSAKFWDQL